MKKLLVSLFFFLTFVQSSFAFWVNPRIIINPPRTYAEARVFNQWARPMVCSGQVAFQTYRGYVQYAYFNNQLIYPGQFAFAYVQTNIYNPFTFGNGGVNCFFY